MLRYGFSLASICLALRHFLSDWFSTAPHNARDVTPEISPNYLTAEKHLNLKPGERNTSWDWVLLQEGLTIYRVAWYSNACIMATMSRLFTHAGAGCLSYGDCYSCGRYRLAP